MKPVISHGPLCPSATTWRHLALAGLKPQLSLLSQLFRRSASELSNYSPGICVSLCDNAARSRPRPPPIPPNYSELSSRYRGRWCSRTCRLLVLFASVSRQRCRDVTVVADALSHTFTTRRSTPATRRDRCRWLKHVEHAGYYGYYVRNNIGVHRQHLNFPLYYNRIICDNPEKGKGRWSRIC